MGQQYSLRKVPDGPERGLWKVQIEAYKYTLHDAEERELWAYHWHPEGLGPIMWPHFHVYSSAGVRNDLSQSALGK